MFRSTGIAKMTNLVQFIFVFTCMFTFVTGNLLLYPVDKMDKDTWCGPFRECPSGTQCMRLAESSKPLSCFLPRYGSIYSFIELHERVSEVPRPAKSHHYEPLPSWLLASSSFGVLCAASIVVWASFYITRRLILCILRANCKRSDQKAESVNQAFRRESHDLNDV